MGFSFTKLKMNFLNLKINFLCNTFFFKDNKSITNSRLTCYLPVVRVKNRFVTIAYYEYFNFQNLLTIDKRNVTVPLECSLLVNYSLNN